MGQDRLLLLRGAREVAALASPDDPKSVTQRAFDAARERSSAHAYLPPARRITEQFGWPWSLVLTVAHEPEERQAHELGAKARGPTSLKWLTEEQIVAVLTIAAQRRSANTVSTREYEATREELLRADRARWLHGRTLLLPTVRQIAHKAGSWDEALRKAGLLVTKERAPRVREKHAPSFPDLMERFYTHYNVQPTALDLKAFASGNGIPYPDPRRITFAIGRKEWLAHRRANGLPYPKKARRRVGRPRKNARPMPPRPDYSRDVGAAQPGERRLGEHRQIKWTREDCVACVARYLDDAQGSRSTLRGYQSWATKQDQAPASGTLKLHASWETMRKLAQQHLIDTRADQGESRADPPDS